jgi:hypothetical protein
LYLGEVAQKLVTPLSLATYRYAMNSPTVYHDLTGFDPKDQSYEAEANPETVPEFEGSISDFLETGQIDEVPEKIDLEAKSRSIGNPGATWTSLAPHVLLPFSNSSVPGVLGDLAKIFSLSTSLNLTTDPHSTDMVLGNISVIFAKPDKIGISVFHSFGSRFEFSDFSIESVSPGGGLGVGYIW